METQNKLFAGEAAYKNMFLCENLKKLMIRPLQKFRLNHRYYVWAEALSDMVFVAVLKLSGGV